MSEKFRDSQWDRHGVIGGILDPIRIPKMANAVQIFEDTTLRDITGEVAKQFDKKELAATIKPGMSVAITAGSRGVANIAIILKEVVAQVKKLGGKPFIFPAMGSHGGATAEGQLEMLKGYNITEEFVGAPIKSSMETVVIGHSPEGKPVSIDKNASEADGILVVARIKPHTAFRGTYESGLLKMMVIGMGKQKGAESCHDEGFGKMAHNVEVYADVIMAKAKILFGLALVENAFDNTCLIESVPTAKFKEREAKLLISAKEWMPKIYLPKFDILIVDQIGKNFSGDGADPNITATYCTPYASGGPEFQRYVILDLSEETHGNAIGLGMADFSTKRAFDKMDFDATYPNGFTCTVVSGVKVPVILKSDKLAIKAAIFCCTGIDKLNPRIVRIKNSSHVEEIVISEALVEEAKKHPNIKVLEEAKEVVFDKDDNFTIGGH
ncbi:nickel-dependent lactate racemase [Treponema primitia]|uniref:lactate racemase domain-containing protein n=1 Tax=Treponema primitia TaxID=88058 RepID=UPI003980CDD7